MGADDEEGDASKKLRTQLTSIGEKLRARLTLATLRPLPIFLGFADGHSVCFSPTAYTLPVAISTPTKGAKSQAGPPPSISARLSLNLSYFLTNYILLSLLALLIISLTHPLMLLYTFLVGGLWYGHSLTLTKNYKLVIANKDVFGDILTPKRRTYICTIVTLFVFIFYALLPLVTVLSVSAAITFAHAALRDPRDIERWERGESDKEDRDREELMAGASV